MLNAYYDRAGIEAAVRKGKHREVIGGLWEEIGELQADFLVSHGLRPHHKVIDIGCGSLRAGVKLIRYLDSGNYYETDINLALIDAGYEIELATTGLRAKLPRGNLVADGNFDFSWCAVNINCALAQSVFTHLPLNFMRVCLERMIDVVAPAGVFYPTIFEAPAHHPFRPYRHEPSGIVTHGAANPYHYRYSDVEFCCRELPWTLRYIGEWGHPRAQRMIEFRRT